MTAYSLQQGLNVIYSADMSSGNILAIYQFVLSVSFTTSNPKN